MTTMSSPPGQLKDLLRDLTRELGVRIAFICEPCIEPDGHAQTLALCFDGSFLENRSYAMAGTPCARVYRRGVAYHSHGVADIYPEDKDLREWGVDTYLGVAIPDSAGRMIGHIGVMHDRGFENPSLVETRLRTMAGEIGQLIEIA